MKGIIIQEPTIYVCLYVCIHISNPKQYREKKQVYQKYASQANLFCLAYNFCGLTFISTCSSISLDFIVVYSFSNLQTYEMFSTLKKHPNAAILRDLRFHKQIGHSLFHLLGVVLDLIGGLDHFVWSAVQLMRDDFLKVLEDNKLLLFRYVTFHYG